MSYPPLKYRLLYALKATLEHYIEMQERASGKAPLPNPGDARASGKATPLALPNPGDVRGSRRRRRRAKPAPPPILGGTFTNSVTAGEHNGPKLSPAEDSQNIMNGFLARLAGNEGIDGG